MLKQYGFGPQVKRIHKNLGPYVPSGAVTGALALILLGGGLLYALPESSEQATAATATANSPTPLASADDSLCDKQTWPYIDQRCAGRVEAARGSRQVRIVTDKGTSVKTVTPLPVVEQKPPQHPPKPVVAQNDRPIGPPVAHAAANTTSEPQTTASVQPAMASSPPPAATKAMASATVPPVPSSAVPASPGVDAIDDTRQKSKSARAAERAEKREAEKAKKREAKRRKTQQDDESDTQDVADAARGTREDRGDRSRSRRARAEVPAEVIDAVEAATARDRGRTVNIESPRGRRVYVVPRDGDL